MGTQHINPYNTPKSKARGLHKCTHLHKHTEVDADVASLIGAAEALAGATTFVTDVDLIVATFTRDVFTGDFDVVSTFLVGELEEPGAVKHIFWTATFFTSPIPTS